MDKSTRIAVIGVSQNDAKYGHKIFRDLLAAGHDVEGVNPAGGVVAGKQIFRSLTDIPETPTLVITVVSPAVTERVVEQCISRGVKEIWMQPGSESAAAIAKAEAAGISVTHHACIMVQEGIW